MAHDVRRYNVWAGNVTSEGILWLLIFVLASWRPPISGFLFGAFRRPELVGAV